MTERVTEVGGYNAGLTIEHVSPLVEAVSSEFCVDEEQGDALDRSYLRENAPVLGVTDLLDRALSAR